MINAGNRPNAGVELNNSLKLFESSIPSTNFYPNKEVRYAIDTNGSIHRFEGTSGVYYWNGSTGDIKNPLDLTLIPNAIRRGLMRK